MKIYSWNVNGIRAILRKGLLDWIDKAKPDVLCVQEIKAHKEVFPKKLLNLKGYHTYIKPADRKGYSGIAIISKKKPLNVITEIGIEKFDSEGRFLILEYEDFFLLNAYFPNSNHELSRLPYKQEFNKAFLDYVKKLDKEYNKPVISCGDFNVAHKEIDLKNPKSNKTNPGFTIEERNDFTNFIENGLVDIYRHFNPNKVKYTWWSYRFQARKRNIGWRIDYFLIQKRFIKKIKNIKILNDIMGSDHCPVMIEV